MPAAAGDLRSTHPLFSYVAAGAETERLIAAQRLARPLGPISELAEQQLGRLAFYRYAKADAGTRLELPGIPGESHQVDAIEPVLRPDTRIGDSRARAIPVRSVITAARELIHQDPRALLCDDDPACRCAAVYGQGLQAMEVAAG